MTTTDPAAVLRAHLDEANELIAGLRNRCGQLRTEVTLRDERIAELERDLQAKDNQEGQP